MAWQQPHVLRRSHQRFWRLFRPPAFRLIYHERYNAQFPDVPNDPLRAERILAFLASERASYITGVIYTIEGGVAARTSVI